MDFFRLNNGCAVVTGAAQGIGKAIALRLAQAGAPVAILDLNHELSEMAAAEIQKESGSRTISVVCDVTSGEQVTLAIETVRSELGRIGILVNNAGIAGRAACLQDLTEQDWDDVIRVDLKSVFLCCRAVIRQMIAERYGKIVNVASIAGKEGNPRMTPYSSAKAGVICFTKALAKEVAEAGVNVNCIAPAVVHTALLDQITPEQVKYMVDKIPMNRTGKPEEVAALVHFLVSDDSAFVTGQCYDISGGRATY